MPCATNAEAYSSMILDECDFLVYQSCLDRPPPYLPRTVTFVLAFVLALVFALVPFPPTAVPDPAVAPVPVFPTELPTLTVFPPAANPLIAPAVVPEVAPEVEPCIVVDGVLMPIELDTPSPVVLTTVFWPETLTPALEPAVDAAGVPSPVAVVCVLVYVAAPAAPPVPCASADAPELESSAAQIPQMVQIDSNIINIVNSLFINNSSYLFPIFACSISMH